MEDIPESLKKLKVADVIKSDLFYINACDTLRDIWNDRENARRFALSSGRRLNPHCIDELKHSGYLEPARFILTYAMILNKQEPTLSNNKRDVIVILGNSAFNKTFKKMIDDEREKENSDRANS